MTKLLVSLSVIALGFASNAMPTIALANDVIAPAASTPTIPKNWRAPVHRLAIQAIVDRIAAQRPDIMSVTVHAVPSGQPAEAYTMIAGTFPDRIGNTSSPGDIITAKKGVTQVESKWGGPDFNRKVSIVIPLKDSAGNYLPAAMVIAFHQNPQSGRIDTDFMAPAIRIRDSLMPEISNFDSLFAKAL